jgi:hypothetical protein
VAISRVDRNRLFAAIEQGGLDPATCELLVGANDVTVSHASSGSSLRLAEAKLRLFNFADYVLTAQVGTDSKHRNRIRIYLDDGDHDWKAASQWAARVVEYEQIPDLWVQLRAASEVQAFAHAADATNGPFTAEEQTEVSRRINDVKQQARRNPELSAAQISRIEEKLDQLVEASTRVGKKDWVTMLSGAAFTLIVSDLVPPHVVHGIITTVITGLGHLFGLGGAPPVLPPQG